MLRNHIPKPQPQKVAAISKSKPSNINHMVFPKRRKNPGISGNLHSLIPPIPTGNTPKGQLIQSVDKGTAVMPGASVQAIQQANMNIMTIQGFRTVLTGTGVFNPTVTLQSSGLMLFGLSLVTDGNTSLADTSVSLKVNNHDYLVNIGGLQLIPNYVQGRDYFPINVPLTGQDAILFTYNKQNAGAATVYLNIFYLPRL